MNERSQNDAGFLIFIREEALADARPFYHGESPAKIQPE